MWNSCGFGVDKAWEWSLDFPYTPPIWSGDDPMMAFLLAVGCRSSTATFTSNPLPGATTGSSIPAHPERNGTAVAGHQLDTGGPLFLGGNGRGLLFPSVPAAGQRRLNRVPTE